MFLLDRQYEYAIRGADAALREADLPLYADVVVALHRLQHVVDKLSAQWGEKPPNAQARRVMHYALEAKELLACFQVNPVIYETFRRNAERAMNDTLNFVRQLPPVADFDVFVAGKVFRRVDAQVDIIGADLAFLIAECQRAGNGLISPGIRKRFQHRVDESTLDLIEKVVREVSGHGEDPPSTADDGSGPFDDIDF